MGYRYPLAAVLRVRELAAEQEERTLARILAEIERLHLAMQRNDTELLQAGETRMTAFAPAALPAMHLHALYAAAAELRARGALLRTQLNAFEELRRQQLEKYTEAYRRRELMVTLRDKDRAAWSAARNASEEKAASEAFLARRMRDARNVSGN